MKKKKKNIHIYVQVVKLYLYTKTDGDRYCNYHLFQLLYRSHLMSCICLNVESKKKSYVPIISRTFID